MASVVNDDDKKFPKSRLSKTYFLTSVRDFCPDGIKLGVERVSKLFVSTQDPAKAQLMVELMLMSDMEKCRLLVLDEEGEYVTEKDDLTGDENRKIVLEPVSADDCLTFPMFMPCGKPKEITNEAELKFYPTSSAYPLFKLALQEAGELPEDMGNKPFITTQEELKECLEGFIFIGKAEEIKGKYNYMRLIAESE